MINKYKYIKTVLTKKCLLYRVDMVNEMNKISQHPIIKSYKFSVQAEMVNIIIG